MAEFPFPPLQKYHVYGNNNEPTKWRMVTEIGHETIYYQQWGGPEDSCDKFAWLKWVRNKEWINRPMYITLPPKDI